MKKLLFLILTVFLVGNTVNSQLVSHWMFEDNAADSIGTNDGTLTYGDPALYVDGVSGKAIDFGAGNDSTHVLVPDDASISFDSTQSFSVSLFLKVKTLDLSARIFVKGSSGKNDPEHPAFNGKRYEMYISNGRIRWAVDDDKTKAQLSVDNASDFFDFNGWNHLVGVRNRADSLLILYINGRVAGELKDEAKLNIEAPGVPLIIGNVEHLKGETTPGLIDEFQIYEGVLTQAQVSTLYRDFVPRPTDVAAYWKLNHDALDETDVNNGTLTNGDPSLYVGGISGAALDFDAGTDSTAVVVDDDASIDFDSTMSFSVSAFVKIADISGGDQFVVEKGAMSVDAAKEWKGKWYALVFKNNELRFAVDDNVDKHQLAAKNAHLKMDKYGWNHIAGVRDVGNTMKVYLNGEEVASAVDTITKGDIASGPVPLYLGNSWKMNAHFHGQIDEVKIYPKALSAAEIADLAAILPAPAEGLAAHWRLNLDGTDETGVNDGTLTNGGDTLFVEGFSGAALDFDAGTDSTAVVVADDASIDFDSTMSFSISAFVKIADISGGDQFVVEKGAMSVDAAKEWKGKWYALVFKNNELRFAIDDNVDKHQLAAKNAHLKMDKYGWNHIAGVRDVGKTMKVYLNGEEVASAVDTITKGDIASGPVPLYLGNSWKMNAHFHGQIDEVKIFNKALSAGEIKAMADLIPIPDDLAAYYKLDLNEKDETGVNNGSLKYGGDTLYVEGHIGAAIDFTDVSDSTHILVPNKESIDFDSTMSFSLSALVKIADISGGDQFVVNKGGMSVDAAKNWTGKWYALSFKSNELRFAVDDNADKSQLAYKNAHFKMDQQNGWNHIVGVRDVGKTMKIYLNGKEVASMVDTVTKGDIASGPVPLYLGNSFGTNAPFHGQIDEARIYNKALSSGDVKDLFNSYDLDIKHAPKDVIAYWRLDGNADDELGISDGDLMYGNESVWVTGKMGQAYDFSEATDSTHILVPHNDVIDMDSSNSFSVSVLMKGDSIVEGIFLVKGSSLKDNPDHPTWDGKRYELYFSGPNLRFAVDDDVTKTQCIFSNASDVYMHKNGWNHIVCVRDRADDSLYIYMNGVKGASLWDETEGNISNESPLIIGNGESLTRKLPDAMLDEIRIYDKALSPADIAALADAYGIVPVIPDAIHEIDDGNSSSLNVIYPNPATTQLTIENGDEISRVTIYGIDGRIMNSVLNVNSKTTTLNLDGLNSGFYIIQIVSVNNDVISKTFIKK